MILSFKTEIDGRSTYFVEKIHKGLRDILNAPIDPTEHYTDDYNFIAKDRCAAKIHTIRMDKARRWKPGVMIDFFINARTENMFRFATRVPVVSIQRVFMTYLPQCGCGFQVSIDGRELNKHQIEEMAVNDGFDTVEEFEKYFINQMEDDEYSGKIIHWTNYRYE